MTDERPESLSSNASDAEIYEILETLPSSIIADKLKNIDSILEEISKSRNSITFAILYSSYSPIQREHVSEILMKFKAVISDKIKDVNTVDIIIHTLGGDADAAFHLGYVLQKYVEELEKNLRKEITVNTVVPRIAKSAGTLLSLCGDRILLTKVSELGPIDPQIRSERGVYVSAKTMRDSLKQVLEIITELSSSRNSKRRKSADKAIENILRRIPVTEMGHYESLMNHVSRLAKELLLNRMLKGEKPEEVERKIEGICRKLVKGYEYHGYVLTYWHLKEMGIKCELVDERIEEMLLRLYSEFKEVERIVSTYLLPPLLPLPEFIAQYMYEVRQLSNGVAVLPTPPQKVDEVLGKILETIESPKARS